MGRPFLITPKVIEQVKEAAQRGLTMEQIAAAFGIHVSTLYEKQANHPELAEVIKNGRCRGIFEVAGKLYKKAMDGDLTAIIFYLKTRAGWSEVQQVEVRPPSNNSELPKTYDELMDVYRGAIKDVKAV